MLLYVYIAFRGLSIQFELTIEETQNKISALDELNVRKATFFQVKIVYSDFIERENEKLSQNYKFILALCKLFRSD